MKYLEYKGYTGSIEYSPEDDLLYGKVLGIRGLISYEGKTGRLLEVDFKGAIDTYLADCKAEGKKTEKPLKGILMYGYQQPFIKRLLFWQWRQRHR